MTKLKIALLQLNPIIHQVEENITKANTILSKLPKSSPIDLLILPEFALTGYNFPNKTAITPYLEPLSKPGPSISWAQKTSQRLGCYTVLGYPQFINTEKLYNSAIVINPAGGIIHNYNKSFLYETDEIYGASEGPGFKTFEIEGIRTSIGICMDLNPYKFEAPFNDFEFSSHCFNEDARLIICPMAWLHSRSPSIQESLPKEEKLKVVVKFKDELKKVQGEYQINDKPGDIKQYDEVKDYVNLHEPDFTNVNYWILRFFPFMNHIMKPLKFNNKATILFCNRSGLENDILYGGSSSIVQFLGTSGIIGYDSIDLTNKSVNVLGALGKGDEGILYREVDV